MSDPGENQPPGWAVTEAKDELDEDAVWNTIAELAWQKVKANEEEEKS